MKKLFCSLALLTTSFAHATTFNSCSWNNPGAHPYTNGASKALWNYPDIPIGAKNILISKIDKFKYDEIVLISRDGISGNFKPQITDMHFGKKSICREIDRSKWETTHRELAMVFCEKDFCILVPTVCRNVSRVRKKDDHYSTPFLSKSNEKGTMEELEDEIAKHSTLPPSVIKKPYELPEPNSAWLIFIGVGVSFLIRRKKL